MNAVTNIAEAPRRSLIVEMAARYGMEPAAFQQTLLATVVPSNTTVEEFAAFLLVARQYGLNPITKEIYAFPKKGGGIQPIVPIDGWTNIINSHKSLDGIEFEDHHNEEGKLTAITCRLWRKDRAKPIMVTEYMAECVRNTDTWRQYPHRMLRHKALIQCARYAFGFAGIVDPDEAERIGVENTRQAPAALQPPTPPAPPPAPEPEIIEPQVQSGLTPPEPGPGAVQKPNRRERQHKAAADKASGIPDAEKNPEDFLAWVDKTLAAVSDADDLASVWNDHIEGHLKDLFPPDREEAQGLYSKHEKRLGHD